MPAESPDSRPLAAFYADDFTGATDAMQALSVAGVETVLFVERPAPETVAAEFPDADAVGLAGQSRSMTPAQMDDRLRPSLAALRDLGAPLVHYKVCSTFDSAPDVGSIGHAIDLGQSVFDSPFVPLLVGAPELGRYVAFGNHFAEYDGDVYRLDRHPVMRDHPVTPMDESDLTRHLGRQTDRPVEAVDLLTLNEGYEAVERAVDAEDGEVVLFDTLTGDHVSTLGRLLWSRAERRDPDRPLFVAGSSGVEFALADRFREAGLVDGEADFPDLPAVDRTVVMSGSASPVTDAQIAWALDAGFEGVRLDAAALVDPETAAEERTRAVADVEAALEAGESVVAYSVRGPDDPSIERVERVAADLAGEASAGERLAREQGRILRAVVESTGVGRACVAGGDTCSYVTPELGVYALETLSPTAPGCPLCRAHARDSTFDGLEIALKGGQFGQEDFFGRVRRGE